MTGNTKHSIGVIGEDIAVKFLKSKEFTILHRNYLKPYGEIDIVCVKDEIVHFVEVKTVSQITSKLATDSSRPEDNVHSKKLARISRVIEVYIEEEFGKSEVSQVHQSECPNTSTNVMTRA